MERFVQEIAIMRYLSRDKNIVQVGQLTRSPVHFDLAGCLEYGAHSLEFGVGLFLSGKSIALIMM